MIWNIKYKNVEYKNRKLEKRKYKIQNKNIESTLSDLPSELNWELMGVFSPSNDMQEAFCSQSLEKEFVHTNNIWNFALYRGA